MQKYAFILALFGIFILIGLLYFIPSKEVNSADEIDKFRDNEKVVLMGIAEEERIYGDAIIFYVNGIKIVCEGCRSGYEGKEVLIEGIVSIYEDVFEVEALSVRTLN